MIRTLLRSVATLALVLSLAPALSAQTFTHNTTTTAAAQTATDTTLSLTSASAATGSSFGAVQVGQHPGRSGTRNGHGDCEHHGDGATARATHRACQRHADLYRAAWIVSERRSAGWWLHHGVAAEVLDQPAEWQHLHVRRE
jgi:hypothetical protein